MWTGRGEPRITMGQLAAKGLGQQKTMEGKRNFTGSFAWFPNAVCQV